MIFARVTMTISEWTEAYTDLRYISNGLEQMAKDEKDSPKCNYSYYGTLMLQAASLVELELRITRAIVNIAGNPMAMRTKASQKKMIGLKITECAILLIISDYSKLPKTTPLFKAAIDAMLK